MSGKCKQAVQSVTMDKLQKSQELTEVCVCVSELEFGHSSERCESLTIRETQGSHLLFFLCAWCLGMEPQTLNIRQVLWL